MKKILILSLAILLLGSATAVFAQTTTAPKTKMTLNLPCVQTAVATRESAIDSAFNTFSTSIGTALSTRATALNTAWGMTDATARRTARNTAWTAYKNSSENARATLKTSKQAAWSAFKTASATCKVPVVESSANDNLSL